MTSRRQQQLRWDVGGGGGDVLESAAAVVATVALYPMAAAAIGVGWNDLDSVATATLGAGDSKFAAL